MQVREVTERKFVSATRYDCRKKKNDNVRKGERGWRSRHLGDSLMKRALMHDSPPGNKLDGEGDKPLFITLGHV